MHQTLFARFCIDERRKQIKCYWCKEVIGRYDWEGDSECACGKSVCPSFRVEKSHAAFVSLATKTQMTSLPTSSSSSSLSDAKKEGDKKETKKGSFGKQLTSWRLSASFLKKSEPDPSGDKDASSSASAKKEKIFASNYDV